jgi:hypothetical protein
MSFEVSKESLVATATAIARPSALSNLVYL